MAPPPKIRIPKIAIEISISGNASQFVANAKELGRDELLAALEEVVHKDFRMMPDSAFRNKYVRYIRTYWGNRFYHGTIKHGL